MVEEKHRHSRVTQALFAMTVTSALALGDGTAAVPRQAFEPPQDLVLIPGGRAAIFRLVGGLEQDPAVFVSNLSVRMLEERVTSLGWQHHLHRRRVVTFIDDFAELRERLGGQIHLSIETRRSRAHVQSFFQAFGYRIRSLISAEVPKLIVPEQPETISRRQVARTLGWDLTRILQKLRGGETIALNLTSEPVPSPIPLSDWAGIVGRPLTSETALRTLAREENVGWSLEGFALLSRETKILFAPHMAWVRTHASRRLARYASSLVVRDGSVLYPGPEEQFSSWEQGLQVSRAQGFEFFRALLDPARDEELIYRWDEEFHRPRPPPEHTGSTPLFREVRPRHSMVMQAVEELTFLSDPSLAAYFEAIEHLGSQRRAAKNLSVIVTFQGGIELLRLLARAGKIPRTSLVELFDAWVLIHRDKTRLFELTEAETHWLEDLVVSLPEIHEQFPGRGPYEARLLAAISIRRDPEVFRYRQLNYEGNRARDLARKMTHQLRVHSIPSLDQILETHRALDHALQAANAQDYRETIRWIRSARRSFLSMPTYKAPLAGFDPGLDEFVHDEARQEVLEFLSHSRLIQKKGRLRKLVPHLPRTQAALSSPLRHMLAGVVYASAVDELENFLFEERRLVHRHTPLRTLGKRRDRRQKRENLWLGADIVSSRESVVGVRVAGHLHDVGKRLAVFARQPGERFSGGPYAQPTRKSVFLFSMVNTPWERITPQTAQAATEVMHAGEIALEQALEIHHSLKQTLPAEFFGWFPLHRLERIGHSRGGSTLASPSELFLLGVIAAEQAAADQISPPFLSAGPLAAQAVRPLGTSWRSKLGICVADARGNVRPTDPWSTLRQPYEQLAGARVSEKLHARELIDLRLHVIPFLASWQLPGRVGADLLYSLLLNNDEALSGLAEYNWQGTLAVIEHFDQDDFEQGMKQCLAKGLYRLQL